MHLIFGSCYSLGPPPCWNLALVQLVDLSCGAATQNQSTGSSRRILYLKNGQGEKNDADLPFSLGEVDPHENTTRHGESAIHEAGFEIKVEKHGRSSIAIKGQPGLSV